MCREANGEKADSAAHVPMPRLQTPHEDHTHELKYTAEVGTPRSMIAPSAATFDPQLANDMRSAFAGVPRVKPQWVDRFFKILVLGEEGLGEAR